jgi:hypothetical protein
MKWVFLMSEMLTCIMFYTLTQLYPVLQDTSFHFTAADLSSAVSAVMLQPCTNRLYSFSVLTLLVRFANCCKQRTHEMWLADGVSVSDKSH